MTKRIGTRVYFLANLIAMACAAARYLLFARILGPHELGLAATIILTAGFLDTITDTGSDRFLIQDQDGGEPAALAMVHVVLVIRGVVTAFILLAGSSLIAAFYKSPGLQVAFIALSAYPFINGFQHADMRRQQRDHDFRAEGVCVIASELGSLAVATWVALVFQNYFCAVVAFIVRAAIAVVCAHLTAKAPYVIRFSRVFAGKLGRFGGPLIMNGVFLFFGGQGDRLVIANRLAVTELGLYSAVSLLGYYPMALVGRFLIGVQMPMIASARGDSKSLRRVLDTVAGDTLMLSIGLTVGFLAVTPFALVPLYGSRFAQSTLVIALVGLLQAFRLLRNWPATVALALGRSLPLMVANIVRLAALPMGIAAVSLGYGLVGVIGAFIVGEAIACAVNLAMVNLALSRSLVADFDRLGLLAACGAGAVMVATATDWLHVGFAVVAGLVVASAAFLRERHNIGRWTRAAVGATSSLRRTILFRFGSLTRPAP